MATTQPWEKREGVAAMEENEDKRQAINKSY